ncbi:DUF262 domain-containing protein [Pectobacterium aroidearum]|uniref:DUF262 domain-containing protein n=1 Tax=Pectobacterium aroidearum TaxID=1201031 RepID=UPI0021156D7E|nr:DUF262 domain-containing protein [Pectobacterium aroidearum]UUE56291.1 DUF262 domain-containing protein [Pectobacterium aroidearum]UUE68997.1 DUF262 domain-containing protein [Pectobacterium aroidearum]UUE73366.1 DUF262 domain-containing protein [Pectobacterium aroidearum]UUE77706.1 DUF262 domain-containing protein [Pectobacterium aroidearum]
MFTESELSMWDIAPKDRPTKMNASEINEKYERGEHRIVTETNIEKLPNFVQALDRKNYMEIRPFYQRRSRWDEERQSKLIESFIINIPVPPVFLYEKSFGAYEVMDGQQRITAISDYYNNRFKLIGLDLWPELNGMYYSDLPTKIKSGLDRRSISSIVLLKESAPDEEDAIFLRQLVFERLNTGGVRLERQEIRNSLSKGLVNDMLFMLARNDLFRKIWGLPVFTEEEETNHKSEIYEESFYKKMEDLEVILRFFALRHLKHFKYGIQGFLDLYLIRTKEFTHNDVDMLKDIFLKTQLLAYSIYGDNVFKLYKDGKFYGNPVKGVYDAVMVALSERLDDNELIINNKESILKQTIKTFDAKGVSSFTGRASTKKDIELRVNDFRQILINVIGR